MKEPPTFLSMSSSFGKKKNKGYRLFFYVQQPSCLAYELLILRMASKNGVGDGSKTPSEIDKEDIESWTWRQIEYLLRRKAAFKGAVTKH
ncbi:hypothetical protein P5673_018590 [Acropora cervicornis]|uniref:Uncharacterized protein n=1 Tax=Acropora cervicornis TaxID=6130 RepID=A0AAD9V2Q5_ACRCE|nr:hypothetical protein P5673_018590 [Acropora cervicornis]